MGYEGLLPTVVSSPLVNCMPQQPLSQLCQCMQLLRKAQLSSMAAKLQCSAEQKGIKAVHCSLAGDGFPEAAAHREAHGSHSASQSKDGRDDSPHAITWEQFAA